MFGDAYDGHDVHRPKYGNVNFLAHVRGDRSASAYGNSYLLLRPQVRARCTITSRDAALGTPEHCAHVLLDVLRLCPDAHRRALAEVLLHLGNPTRDGAVGAIEAGIDALRSRGLHYTELQIHGSVDFARDVTLVVVAGEDVARGRALGEDAQAALWRRFKERFGVAPYHMSAHGMVPLG